MPRPPLLLADRVTALDAEPMSMKKGSITTETDVGAEAWYLHQGRMPGGVMVEAGQADLMLISYLGVDFLNRGERVYRLLGCELTYHSSLCRPGDTLVYDIHVDGHANQGDVRLFFFHYDCRVGEEIRLSVRQGQAGFFSDRDLAFGLAHREQQVLPLRVDRSLTRSQGLQRFFERALCASQRALLLFVSATRQQLARHTRVDLGLLDVGAILFDIEAFLFEVGGPLGLALL